MGDSPENDLAWWQREVVYQIYPRSFQDSDGDGNGDLKGICRRLDYLFRLGVGALWICPIFRSPMADGGYDIADYNAIDPIFGSLDDFDVLLREAHERGLKVVLDLVPNHTSDQHAWFVESRRSRNNPKRDWYVWRDPGQNGEPPSNWLSHFGGSAWTHDEATGQFYYHAFLASQPDLNWRNPQVRAAIYDAMRFWLAKGIDGFRVDAITALVEDDLLRDDPPNPQFRTGMSPDLANRRVFTHDRPETHLYIGEMRDVLDEFKEKVLIGEVHLPLARAMAYYGRKRPVFHLPFNFQLLRTNWDARSIAAAIDQYMILLPEHAWPNWVLGNHDESRLASRIGRDQARVAAMLLMTQKGTPFIYNGEELGMGNVAVPRESIKDSRIETMGSRKFSRDVARTPMRWDATPGSGFTTGEPWLPLGAKENPLDAAAQEGDTQSVLNLHRKLIALRRDSTALIGGDYVPLASRSDVLAYERRSTKQRFRIALNLGSREQVFAFPGRWKIVLSTMLDGEGVPVAGSAKLRPDEGLIAECLDGT